MVISNCVLSQRIKTIIQIWLSTGRAKSAYDINCGSCGIFADEIIMSLEKDYSKQCAKFIMTQETYDYEEFVKKNFPYHVWIEYNGNYYDSECPDGVDNVIDIPYFKQLLSETE